MDNTTISMKNGGITLATQSATLSNSSPLVHSFIVNLISSGGTPVSPYASSNMTSVSLWKNITLPQSSQNIQFVLNFTRNGRTYMSCSPILSGIQPQNLTAFSHDSIANLTYGATTSYSFSLTTKLGVASGGGISLTFPP